MKKFVLPAILIGIIGILIGLFALGNRGEAPSSTPKPPAVRASPDGLPGLMSGNEPWVNNTDKLGDRLDAIGLPQLATEGTVLHIHQHLDIYVNGQHVDVPAAVGIPLSQSFISPLHTHDTSGVIHVESPTEQDFYLGQFFDVWGLKFDGSDLGGHHADASNQLAVYVNGSKVSTDPRKVVLAAHQEIVVSYGPASSLPSPVPSTYAFPAGE